MYKDKDKQREADKERQRRYRLQRRDSVTMRKGVTKLELMQGVTGKPTATEVACGKPPEVIDGKYNREYLPGGRYYVGCCYQDGDGNWHVKHSTQRTSRATTSDAQVKAVWDRRNQQGQPGLYGDWPDRAKTEAI